MSVTRANGGGTGNVQYEVLAPTGEVVEVFEGSKLTEARAEAVKVGGRVRYTKGGKGVVYTVINDGKKMASFNSKDEARAWMNANGGTSMMVEYK